MRLLILSPVRPLTTAIIVSIACLCGVGCGDSSTVPSPPTASTPPSDQALPTSPDTTDPPPTDTRDPRTKWVGDIPYDVFFDQPLEVATEGSGATSIRLDTEPQRTESSSETESVAIAPAPDDGTDAKTPAETSASPPADWGKLASVDLLNEEVKQLRNSLTANLRTVATYNRNLEAIANDSAVLAGLAAVIDAHPGSLSWRGKAKFVRDLAASIASDATSTGREPYSAVQQSFEQIVTILNGGPAPDREASASVPFSEIVDRSELMKRTERSFDWLKAEINTADRFAERPEDIVREATVLAVIGGLISTDSYDSADEPAYQEFAREFIEANLAMTSAVNATNYEQFTIARDRVQNACTACHGEYAFGDEGL